MSQLMTPEVSAVSSLRVQPLSYEDSLQKGEKKKGFIDVTNPTGQEMNLQVSVRGFKQIDDQGSLQLFDSERIRAGIIPDLEEFTLKAGQTMRLMFLIDGTKLPEGDVFAALMVANIPDQVGNMAQAVQVGTLFLLENGTPGARDADITKLDVSFFQIGDAVKGSYSVKNTAPVDSSSGFKPKVSISLAPLTNQMEQTSSLIFAGRERSNQFELKTQRFGFYKIAVSHQGSELSRWVFVASPLWIGGLVLLLLLVTAFIGIRKQRKSVGFLHK